MREKAKQAIYVLVSGMLASALSSFIILCMGFFELGYAVRVLILVLSTALNVVFLAVDLIAFFLKKEAVYKFCSTGYVLLLIFAAMFFALLKTGLWEIFRDEARFEEYLKRSGRWIVFAFIALQFAQVVILPIPSTVTVVAGVALFGSFWGSVYSLIGIITGSLCAYLIGKYAGYRVVAWIVGKETLAKWLDKIRGKDKLLLSAMFLLPVFPDDVLCFVAGISSMSVWMFLGVIVISRILAVFTTSYSVVLIPFNTWWGILIWVVFFALLAVLFVVLYRKSDAILGWIERKFHREKRIRHEVAKDEFSLEIVDPDGSVVTKGVKKGEVPGRDASAREEKNRGDRGGGAG